MTLNAVHLCLDRFCGAAYGHKHQHTHTTHTHTGSDGDSGPCDQKRDLIKLFDLCPVSAVVQPKLPDSCPENVPCFNHIFKCCFFLFRTCWCGLLGCFLITHTSIEVNNIASGDCLERNALLMIASLFHNRLSVLQIYFQNVKCDHLHPSIHNPIGYTVFHLKLLMLVFCCLWLQVFH